MKILIEKRTVDVYIPAAVGRNNRRIESACLGLEVEVDRLAYKRWQRVVDSYAAVQKEMEGVVG